MFRLLDHKYIYYKPVPIVMYSGFTDFHACQWNDRAFISTNQKEKLYKISKTV